MILTLIIFSIANLILAFIDAHKFIKSKTVSHFVNGAEYIAMCLVAWFIFHNIWLIGVLLFNRLLVFNIMLSLFRGLKWDYVSPAPESKVDQLAKFFFGMNGKLMYAVYSIIFVALLIVSLVW